MSFIEELFKTKGILKAMKDKIDSGSADVDVVEYSLATKVLENKLAILSATNTSTDKEDGTIVLNIEGTDKKMTINLEKLKEAITFSDGHEVQKPYNAEEHKVHYEPIDASGLTPEEYIAKAAEKILPIKKSGKVLHKETFIKLFHYTGDYAKFRTTELKAQAQEKRLQHFQVDSKKYLEEMKATVAAEERVYEQASKDLFEAVSISPEIFERTQHEMMMDPMVSMELFQMGINMEKPSGEHPSEMTKERTVELVKQSNDFAFDYFKREYISQLSMDPLLMPVLISALAHDFVKKEHGIGEEAFKAALFVHKIYEDEEVAMHMQMKQMELLSLSGGFNPMMMGGMPGMGGMGGMGGMPDMGGMGGGFGGPGGFGMGPGGL
jgi:hypothetical protein